MEKVSRPYPEIWAVSLTWKPLFPSVVSSMGGSSKRPVRKSSSSSSCKKAGNRQFLFCLDSSSECLLNAPFQCLPRTCVPLLICPIHGRGSSSVSSWLYICARMPSPSGILKWNLKKFATCNSHGMLTWYLFLPRNRGASLKHSYACF